MKRVKNDQIAKKVAILAAAFVIFWLYLGSLINFHQYHIFGRTLVPDGIMCKREETITVDGKTASFIVLIITDFIVELSDPLIHPQAESEIYFSSHTGAVIVSLIPTIHGLRAPPATA